MELIIEGRKYNSDQVERMFAMAPQAMRRVVSGWMYRVKERYIGVKKKSGQKVGVYRRYLMRRKKTEGRGNYGLQYSGLFTGHVKKSKLLSGNRLEMGIPKNKKSGFIQGVRMRENGGGTIRSSKYMPVPIWKNLKGLGYESNPRNAREQLMDRLFIIKSGGKLLYVDSKSKGSVYDRVMFVGKKSVRIKGYKHNFEPMFKKKWPMYTRMARSMMDKRIRAIEKGYGYYGDPKHIE